MERGKRAVGIPVDPARVRKARLEAGLSLAQVAREDVSRTLIHFVETGRARPSRRVLELIAKRTGRPIAYFTPQPSDEPQPRPDLERELKRVARLVRAFHTDRRLTRVELEAMKMVEVMLRQAAALTRSVQADSTLERSPAAD